MGSPTQKARTGGECRAPSSGPSAPPGEPTRLNRPAPTCGSPCGLIGLLAESGVSMVNVSLGNPYASPHLLRPFENPPPDGYETPEHPLTGVARHSRARPRCSKSFRAERGWLGL